MCVNCGCGEVQERHKPGGITIQDVEKAAANHDMTVVEVASNIQNAVSVKAR